MSTNTKNSTSTRFRKHSKAAKLAWTTRYSNMERDFYNSLTTGQKAAFTKRKNSGVDFITNRNLTVNS